MTPTALTIAGSDSSGGAGIQADLKTFHQWGVYGMSAITAVTAQNTTGIQDVHLVPASVVATQLSSVARDIRPDAIKTGMLANRSTVSAVAKEIRQYNFHPFVLDPVAVATSGDSLLASDAVDAIKEELIPLADLVTPNWSEAVLLTGIAEPSRQGRIAAAKALVDAGAGSALIKGGHLVGETVLNLEEGRRPGSERQGVSQVEDLFWNGSALHLFSNERLVTPHTHGTGCTLSAAVAAGLAHGRTLLHAVEEAIAWVHGAIATAPGLGAGRGPLNHFRDSP